MRRLSQNFLADPNIRDKIIQTAHIQKNETLLEIGPGKGALTKALLKASSHVIALEKDPDLEDRLRSEFPSLELYMGDALEYDYTLFNVSKVVANIPYHITKEILLKIENSPNIHQAILMVQLEVAEKLIAPLPNSYFTAHIQSSFECKLAFKVPKKCFSPAPKVDSAVIHLTRKKDKLPPGFINYLKLVFSRKRKTIRSSLKKQLKDLNLDTLYPDLGINTQARPEELDVDSHLVFFRKLTQVSNYFTNS